MGGAFAVAIAGLFVGQSRLQGAISAVAVEAPRFEVDPFWPKPLPNHWILGSTIGVGVDSRDHVFIVHRGDSTLNQRTEAGADANPPIARVLPRRRRRFSSSTRRATSCRRGAAPARAIPGRRRITASRSTTRTTSGSAATAQTDSHILKFTHDGKFLAQFGAPGQAPNSHSTTHFGRVAKISFDTKANEAYVADGYGNKRVAVIDMESGKIKRFWGAYGNKPDDTNLGPYDPDAPLGPAVPHAGALRGADPTTAWCTSATDRTIASRSSARTARS